MKLTFDITEDHIRKGVARHGFSCPASLALHERTGLVFLVLKQKVQLGFQHPLVFDSPPELIEFVRQVDEGAALPKPITVTLELPDSLFQIRC